MFSFSFAFPFYLQTFVITKVCKKKGKANEKQNKKQHDNLKAVAIGYVMSSSNWDKSFSAGTLSARSHWNSPKNRSILLSPFCALGAQETFPDEGQVSQDRNTSGAWNQSYFSNSIVLFSQQEKQNEHQGGPQYSAQQHYQHCAL